MSEVAAKVRVRLTFENLCKIKCNFHVTYKHPYYEKLDQIV